MAKSYEHGLECASQLTRGQLNTQVVQLRKIVNSLVKWEVHEIQLRHELHNNDHLRIQDHKVPIRLAWSRFLHQGQEYHTRIHHIHETTIRNHIDQHEQIAQEMCIAC